MFEGRKNDCYNYHFRLDCRIRDSAGCPVSKETEAGKEEGGKSRMHVLLKL